MLAIALLFPAAAATVNAAPIVGQTGGGDNTVIDCRIDADGDTICATAKGRAAVCRRRAGDDIRRSYRRYDYVPSPEGCTLDAAYWRDHGLGGPSPYDPTWDRLGSEGPKTSFFNSGRSYLDMFAATGSDGPYDQLASAFVAAELNRINGAALSTEVSAAFDEAVTLLLTETAALAPEKAARFAELAKTLRDFTAGAIGAGQCSREVEPLGPGDIGKPIHGLESADEGSLKAVSPGDGSADGILAISPAGAGDHFLVATEDFAVDGVRKGRFTTTHNDCVALETGEQTIIPQGENPGGPTFTSTGFLDQTRNLLIMIALNEDEAPDAVAPAAGPGAAGPSTPTATPTTTTTPTTTGGGFPAGSLPATSSASGGGGTPPATPPAAPATTPETTPAPDTSFPSPTLPSTAAASITEPDLVVVPDVVGRSQSQAANILSSVDLTVDQVTVVSSLSGGSRGLLIRSAFAQNADPIVQSQSPPAGTQVERFSGVSLFVTLPVTDLPEPSSLALFLVALSVITLLLWWRKRDASERA